MLGNYFCTLEVIFLNNFVVWKMRQKLDEMNDTLFVLVNTKLQPAAGKFALT